MESGNSSRSNYTSSSDDVPALPSNKYVPKKNDVFLSFTGKDSRSGFTAHLHAALCRVGINTFKDDTKLELGEPFPQKLLLAIQDSSCSVIILSKNYAFSVWCLKELVQIVKCMKTRGQVVIPIFYHVGASDVRHQKGSYGEALLKHEKYHGLSTLKSWKRALTCVSYLNGEVVTETSNEAELIQKFVQHISKKVKPPFPYILNESHYISKGLFGIEQRIKDLNSYVRVELVDRVCMIGICGMGGIGKTQIARAYYEFMYSQFEGGSFLYNVGEVYENEYNPICLQKQLLSQCTQTEEWTSSIFNTLDGKPLLNWRLCSRKVLVVLDGVDQLKQLEELAANCEWFGPGSRILITTRDEDLLAKHGVTVVYKVESLNRKEALELFSFHAYKHPREPNYSREYTELHKEVLTYANGLPLALCVLGTLLSGQNSPSYWRNEFERLKEYPPKDIIDVLEMGFDKGLEKTEKTIFLDIACFFKGRKKDFITRVMDCCGFHPKCNIGITSLVGKSLLTIRDDEIWMHDLLQEMGRQIVTRKFRGEPWAWSRLWSNKDLSEVLTYNNSKSQDEENVEASDILTNDTVEAICIHYPGGDLDLKVFSYFRKLRLLCISGPGSGAHPLASTTSSKLHFNCLRFMKWEGYPFQLLPSGFRSNRLVELHLESSCIVELFDNPKMEPMHSLKIINLGHSKSLIKIQCLQYVAPNLEELLLSFCCKLKEIDMSITDLKKLTCLDVQYCGSLKYLPGNMKFLKVLNLRCRRCLPSTIEFYVDRLEELNLNGSIASTIVFGGKELFSSYCLNFLKRLELRRCFLSDESFPADSFCCFSSLEYLDLSDNSFKVIPQGILSRLIKLRYLHLDDCCSLERLGELPSSLELISTIDCLYLQDPILVTQSNLRCLAALIFLECYTLVDECNGVEAMLLTSLERHVQNSLSTRFDIVIPGRKIPEWFIRGNMKRCYSSVSMDLHPNWCNNKWMGFVLCLMYDAGGDGGLVGFQGQVKINGLDSGYGPINTPHTLFLTKMINDWVQGKYDNEITYLCVEHVWMIYLPRIIHFQTKWKLDENSSCRIEFKFHGESIISSGARLLYEGDIEEFKQHQNGEFLNLI